MDQRFGALPWIATSQALLAMTKRGDDEKGQMRSPWEPCERSLSSQERQPKGYRIGTGALLKGGRDVYRRRDWITHPVDLPLTPQYQAEE